MQESMRIPAPRPGTGVKGIFSLLLVSAICLCLETAAGAASPSFTSNIETLDASNFTRIELGVDIRTSEPAPTRIKEHLSLREDGTPVKDFEVMVDERPVYITLVLDRSGSMEEAMKHLKAAALDFVRRMKRSARTFCSIVSFADEVEKECDFTDDWEALQDRIVSLESGGATALYDAVYEALETLAKRPATTRRVVVLFTDGCDQNLEGTARLSRHTAREVVKKARKLHVPLFIVGLGDGINEKLLTKTAALARGRFFHSPDKERLGGIFEEAADSLHRTYLVSYVSPRPVPDGTIRRVQIVSDSSGTRGQGKARYRAPSRPREAPSKRLREMKQRLAGLRDFSVDVAEYYPAERTSTKR